MRIIPIETENVTKDFTGWDYLLKSFEDYSPFKCKFPERLNYWRFANLVGEQQRTFNIWCGLKFARNGIGLELGSAGVKTPFCVSTDIRPMQGVELVCMGENLPFKDERFNLVLANHVFEHCWKPAETLMEWVRVLKQFGHLAVILPDHRLSNTLSLDKDHKYGYNPQSLMTVMPQEIEIISLDNLKNKFSFEFIGKKL